MGDFDSDDFLDELVGKLRAGLEDLSESPSGELPDWWMCPSCGAFMHENHPRCLRCRGERF